MLKGLIENTTNSPIVIHPMDGAYVYSNTDIIVEVGSQQEIETDVFYLIQSQLLDLEKNGFIKIIQWPVYSGSSVAVTEVVNSIEATITGTLSVNGSSYVAYPTPVRPNQMQVGFTDIGSPADQISCFARMIDDQWALLLQWTTSSQRMVQWSYVMEPTKTLNTDNLRYKDKFKGTTNGTTLV